MFGANNDTQYLLVNSGGDELLMQLGNEEYQQYFSNLLASQMGGLEHHNGVHILEEYATGYTCKGGEHSTNWKAILRAVTTEYCSRDVNENRSIKSLVAKHMNAIAGSMSILRDQASYLLAGGIMKCNSFGNVKKCSVNDIDISRLGETGGGNTFQWKNIKFKYTRRDETLEGINVYKFCVYHFSSKVIIPQFFGFKDVPTWPLEEEYSKWMLNIFKPWRASSEELRYTDGTYSSTLVEFLVDPLFPARKGSEILRAKLKVHGVDTSEGADIFDGNIGQNVNVVEDEMFNDILDNAISQNESLGSNKNSPGWGGIIIEINNRAHLIAPVYYCPDNPRNTLSTTSLIQYCAFKSAIVHTNKYLEMIDTYNITSSITFEVYNDLDHVSICVLKFYPQSPQPLMASNIQQPRRSPCIAMLPLKKVSFAIDSPPRARLLPPPLSPLTNDIITKTKESSFKQPLTNVIPAISDQQSQSSPNNHTTFDVIIDGEKVTSFTKSTMSIIAAYVVHLAAPSSPREIAIKNMNSLLENYFHSNESRHKQLIQTPPIYEQHLVPIIAKFSRSMYKSPDPLQEYIRIHFGLLHTSNSALDPIIWTTCWMISHHL